MSKELLVNKFNMILGNQGTPTLNDKKIPLPNDLPEISPGFAQKQPPEVFCKIRYSLKVCKFHRKTPMLDSLFDKVAGLQAFSRNFYEHLF